MVSYRSLRNCYVYCIKLNRILRKEIETRTVDFFFFSESKEFLGSIALKKNERGERNIDVTITKTELRVP